MALAHELAVKSEYPDAFDFEPVTKMFSKNILGWTFAVKERQEMMGCKYGWITADCADMTGDFQLTRGFATRILLKYLADQKAAVKK